jgi:hypothetical protein
VKRSFVTVLLILAAGTGACGHGGSGASSGHDAPDASAPSSGTPERAATITWTSLPSNALGPGHSRIVDIAATPSGVVGVGSVTTAGRRVPAAWTSRDGETWTRLAVEPKSVYGFVSELTTVAATGDGKVSAIGQAVGGTHGNPRVGSWYLDGSTLREVVAPVELYGGPRQGSVDEMAGGPTGFVVVGMRTDQNERTGAAVWTSPDARTEFAIRDTDPALESGPHELVRALGAAADDQGYLAVGDITVDGRIDDDAMAWTSPDGVRWTRVAASAGTFGGPDAEMAQLATPWQAGWAAAGIVTNQKGTSLIAWVSRDGARWRRVVLTGFGTSPDVLSEVTSLDGQGGRLYLGGRLGARFVAARSDDGLRWTPIVVPDGAKAEPHARLLVQPVGGRLVVAATTDAGTRLWSAVGR